VRWRWRRKGWKKIWKSFEKALMGREMKSGNTKYQEDFC
jgi:hypothetical protein